MNTRANAPRFEDLTETTGIPLTDEGASMMYTRYAHAAGLVAGKRVLELGCGSGQGFGLIGRTAGKLVGGDCSMPLLRGGRRHYSAHWPFVQLSADSLPFRAGAFDVVLFFEATYYVPDMEAAFDELARVLSPEGMVMFVNANPERPDFIRSPHSVHYHTADEFRAALRSRGFDVSVEGAFRIAPPATGAAARVKGAVFGVARQVLEGLGLVPKTLRGRARLKRLVYGTQQEVPVELPEGFAAVAALRLLPRGPQSGYKVLYVLGRRGAA